MNIFSESFKNSEFIPRKYTCDGIDISPPLSWDDVPVGTHSFTLICDDPDALGKPWVHWIIFNLPAETRALAENIKAGNKPAEGGVHGINSWGDPGYGGPCPPGDIHHYFFRLYALDCYLESDAGKNKETLISAMKGHILGEAEIMGRYTRN